ncbi:deoxyguanosine kinase [Candidatus Magnetominusculus xianensis]|uniref:Deoxyguanosine kinase n=2 Tax=Candidatus Magnetominusculus xianensis TaxID=1748249 RepID=A0ABR5SHS7_9BACT|nr:deoxyguanosine kinase [Candidatus Magnetominusculus xianensis]
MKNIRTCCNIKRTIFCLDKRVHYNPCPMPITDSFKLLRVEVCGGIASGKTTFAALLSDKRFNPLLEDFRSNPFWVAFYSDPGKYIFETEVSFTLQHYHQVKKESARGKINICDFSFLLDSAYANVGLQGSQLSTYLTVYEEIKRELSPPLLVIHLNCDAETELKRIRFRGRDIENPITLDFLNSLNLAVEKEVQKAAEETRVISVNSAQKNFADIDDIKEEILNLMTTILL